MLTLSRYLLALAASLVFFIAALATPPPAAAQCVEITCDSIPPEVTIAPGTGSYTISSLSVTIGWCDDNSLSSGSRKITLDGVDVTGSFGYSTGTQTGCAVYAESAGTISLTGEGNTLHAEICDAHTHCGSSSVHYTIEGSSPTISIDPAGGSFTDSSLSVTVNWSDDQGLNANTRSITLNGTDVTSGFGYSGDATSAQSSGSVTLVPGDNTLSARICDDTAICITEQAAYEHIDPVYDLSVTPDDGNADIIVGQAVALDFTVRNDGSIGSDYALTASCTGGALASGCTLSSASGSLAAGAETMVTVRFTSSSTLGSTGRIQLLAEQVSDSTVRDTGWVDVTVGTQRTPVVSIGEVNPGASVERGLCLTIAAGSNAAYECGDLRVVHALPTTRTLNRARTPTLLYNSQHAYSYRLVASEVMLPIGAAQPDEVIARLLVDGSAAPIESTWNGGEWSADKARRIVLSVPTDGLATGIYGYTLEVINRYHGIDYTRTARGEVAVVDRRDSPFGAGWWLAGLEQLHSLAGSDDLLWVGGDGSTRRYEKGADGVWAAENIDRPDTLRRNGPGYVRELPGGLRVHFDDRGRHIATINRLGHETEFGYDAAGRLETIMLPGVPLSYSFAYDGSGRLQTITAPPADTLLREVTLSYDHGDRRVTSIRDPDQTTVGFGYSGTGSRITSRTDRRQTVTDYVYDTGGKLSQSATRMGDEPDIVTIYQPLKSKGLAGSVCLCDAYTLLDGPRPDADALDHTRFWLDRWGAPRRIRNAHNHETTLIRGDATYPALVTRVQHPNGRLVEATYDDRGNLVTSTDVNPYGAGEDAITRYEWDPKWDFVTKITLPEGEVTQLAYDPANGNRLWMKPTGDATRADTVHFAYNSSGLIESVLTPSNRTSGAQDRFDYDERGNLRKVLTPMGFQTLYFKDSVGRDTLIVSPVDTVSARDSAQLVLSGAKQRIWYDVMGRDTLSRTTGPEVTYQSADSLRHPDPITIPEQTLVVRSEYDPEGNLIEVSRWSEPDPANIGTVTNRWDYDRANRVIAEVAPDNATDRTIYDPAGNVVQKTTRRRHRIEMTYDPLNRLTERRIPGVSYDAWNVLVGDSIWHFPLYVDGGQGRLDTPNHGSSGLSIPGDVQTFTYDAVGNLLTATNAAASVHRTYYRNGRLRTDTLSVNAYTEGDTTKHAYGLLHVYDRNGRRTELHHPVNLAPRDDGEVHALARASFHPQTGQPDTIYDVFGSAYTFIYDLEGRLTRYTAPDGSTEEHFYDPDGRRWRRLERAGGATGALLHDDTLFFDARARVLRAGTRAERTRNVYSGLGALALSHTFRYGTEVEFEEETLPDALGHHTRIRRTELDSGTDDHPATVQRHTYAPATGRLRATGGGNAAVSENTDSLEITYDAAGNQELRSGWREIYYPMPNSPYTTLAENTRSYYDAEGRLRLVDRRTCVMVSGNCDRSLPPYYPDRPAFEEYRYDALGRRILVRSRSDWACENRCAHTLTRVVWDGAQILYEIRAPGHTGLPAAAMARDTGLAPSHTASHFPYGRVAYTHGLTLDRPLSLVRMEYSDTLAEARVLLPHRNWLARVDTATFAPRGAGRCEQVEGDREADTDPAVYVDHCVEHEWPAPLLYTWRAQRPLQRIGPVSWMGSLAHQQRDASGQYYRRNRYYDPATAQWTQEDPIGLAGGLNLYGFAAGDPVNFSDPFGLCPVCGAAYVVFEVGATLYDLGDLAITGIKYARGNASGAELSVTAAGVAAGVTGFGGGYGPVARTIVRESASDVRLWKQLASEELLGEARAGRGVVIAGAGHRRGRQVDDIARLTSEYGGNPQDWAKMSTRERLADDGTRISIHWYENIRTGQRMEFKQNLW